MTGANVTVLDTSRRAHGTGIEWTHVPGFIGETWNPVAGCWLESPGCANCYAMPMAHRHKHMTEARTGRPDASPYYGTTQVVNGIPVWTGKVNLVEQALPKPLSWRRPRAIFVNSMSDLFHPDVPDEWIDMIFATMALCPRHIFIILTKRPDRMRRYLSDTSHSVIGNGDLGIRLAQQIYRMGAGSALGATITPRIARSMLPLPNVWLGTSVEDQRRADERLPHLIETPAALRLVSVEPMLEAIELGNHIRAYECHDCFNGRTRVSGHFFDEPCPTCGGTGRERAGLDWVLCGLESGPRRREIDIAAADILMRQCRAAGVPFFFKQDNALRPGQRGRASDELWSMKQFPATRIAA